VLPHVYCLFAIFLQWIAYLLSIAYFSEHAYLSLFDFWALHMHQPFVKYMFIIFSPVCHVPFNFFLFFLFIYSHVHTLFGSFLPLPPFPPPSVSGWSHSALVTDFVEEKT
jgi:hypothetical protein